MKQPRVIPRRAERLAIARLLVQLAKGSHAAAFVGTGKPFGAEIDVVFVTACVAIGDFEGRPMNTSDISTYIDMPRATVQRKLAELTKRDIITRKGNKYTLSQRLIEGADRFVDAANNMIAKAQPKE
jgi:CRP-like cAMP-binding protein